MKLFNFYKGGAVSLGALIDDKHIDIARTAKALGVVLPSTVDDVIKENAFEAVLAAASSDKAVVIDGEVEFAPALVNPPKMLCIGRNYLEHAAETGHTPPTTPEVFCKLENAMNGHKGDIPLTSNAYKYDYEAELVIIIGREARDVTCDEAGEYIFGYTCGMDFSVREIQNRQTQWLLGKSFDKGGPTGPYVVRAKDIDNKAIDVKCYVNDELRQTGNTSQLIFSCEFLVSYISRYMTLKPGDMIFTGTPSGVIMGYPLEKQVWLKAGDTVKVELSGIGSLENRLVHKQP